MPNYHRYYIEGGIYFLTIALQNRKSDLLIRHMAELRQAYRETLAYYPFKTIAITILSEHLHWIIQLPEKESDFSRIVKLFKTRFTQKIPTTLRHSNQSQNAKNEAGIWQRRFWEHYIRDEIDLKNHIYYTYYNPVKHGHVMRVKDWPYSSFHLDVKNGLFAKNWGDNLPAEILYLYNETEMVG